MEPEIRSADYTDRYESPYLKTKILAFFHSFTDAQTMINTRIPRERGLSKVIALFIFRLLTDTRKQGL